MKSIESSLLFQMIYIGCPSPSYKAVLDVISSLILPGNDADGPLRASLKMLCIWVWTRRLCKYAHIQIHNGKYAMVKCVFFGCFECYMMLKKFIYCL